MMRSRDRRSRNRSRPRSVRGVSVLFCAASLFAGGAVLAQPAEDDDLPPGPREFQDPAARELEDARRALEDAQRNFEEAVRETQTRDRERSAASEAARERSVRERQVATERADRERSAARDESRGEIERARRELEAARRNLEEAAREVARLSARAASPIVESFRRQWIGTGQRAMLGLVVEDAPDGARVTAVTPGGPAAEAGIQTDDVIVSIDGRMLAAPNRRPSRVLIERLTDVEPGTVVAVGVTRDGMRRDFRVETRERESNFFTFERPRVEIFRSLFPQETWSSMELVSLTPELGAYFGTNRGLLVVRAPDDESLMLQDGDVILDINGREPNSPEHAMRILGTFEPGETIEMTIMRRQQRQTLEIPVTGGEPNGGDDARGESA